MQSTVVPESSRQDGQVAVAPLSAGQAFLAKVKFHWPLVLLMLVTLVAQAYFFAASAPQTVPDTISYQRLADGILHGNWSGFFFRTPGYPLFLALIQGITGKTGYAAVMAVQFLLGSAIPLLLYAIAYLLGRNRIAAALAGSVFLLDRYSIGIQTLILTEFLAQLLVLVALLAYFLAVREKKLWSAPIVGLLFFTLLIVRPSFQMLYLCVVFGGLAIELLYAQARQQAKRTLLWYALFLLAVQLPIWGWSYKLYRDYGHFSISLQLGASFTNQTGDIMEQAPASYGPLRDMYVEQKKANHGDHINVIEQILNPLSKATGMPLWEISLKYMEIDKLLIRNNPKWYARRVYYGWVYMWNGRERYLIDPSPFFSYSENNVFWGKLYRLLDTLYFNRLSTLDAMPYLFFALVAAFLWVWRKDRMRVLIVAILAGAVFYNMLLTAMVQFTEFGRYRLPVQPLYLSFVVCVLCLAAQQAVVRWKQARCG